jgi:hypothetical protein
MALLSDSLPTSGSRLRGRDRRAFSVSTKLTGEEFDSIVEASQNSCKAIGEWAREALLREANGARVRLSHEDVMTELVGLELLLMNALAPLIRGETMSTDWYNNLVKQARESKQEAAKVVIAKRLADRQKPTPV